jgi:hypothetical protein
MVVCLFVVRTLAAVACTWRAAAFTICQPFIIRVGYPNDRRTLINKLHIAKRGPANTVL